jgi:hypothetical protein
VGPSKREVGIRKGRMSWMYLILIYENKRMILVEIVLRRGGRKRENNGEGISN